MNGLLMISPKDVSETLRFEQLIEPVADAFRASSAGMAQNGLIVMYPQADRTAGDVYVKSAVIEARPFHIVKVAPWFAVNVAQKRLQGGFIGVFDSQTGHTVAMIEDRHLLSDLRTAAAGALAARVLAPKNITTASILGSGVQAYWQVLALHCERPFEILNVWARDTVKADALADRLRARLPKVSIAVRDRKAAICEADVILTATSARDPIVPGAWLRPGQHITAVGADDATKCELDAAVLTRARVFVDEIETAVSTGDIHRAISSNSYSANQIEGEIGDVLSGGLSGRRSADEITVATFSGIGAQDLAAVEVLLECLTQT